MGNIKLITLFILTVALPLLLISCGPSDGEETAIPSLTGAPTMEMTEAPSETITAETVEPEGTPEPEEALTEEAESVLTPTAEPAGLTAVIVSGDAAGTGKPFTFDATQSEPGASPIVAYEWNMGDDTYLFGISVEHAYMESGEYIVELTVEDQEGNRDTAMKTIEVIDPLTPTAESSFFLNDTRWQMDNAIRGTTVTLEFSGNTLSGNAGCNDYTAPYTATPIGAQSADIVVGPISSTSESCTLEVNAQEQGYLDSLAEASSVTVEGDKLNMETRFGMLSFSAVEETG